MSTRRFSRPTALTGAAALALTLAACGGGTTTGTATSEPATAATTEAPAESTAEATDDATATAEATDDQTDDPSTPSETATVAVTTAEAELDGSRAVAFDIDRDDDDNYEVTVTDGNSAQEIEVSPDGTRVLSVEEEDVDADDRATLDAAGVDMLTAIDNALAERPGTVTEVELDEDDGTIAWQIEIDDQDIFVDASTGQIISR